jgi:response regulator RpfG family c-di-GMP phosphodiesterase
MDQFVPNTKVLYVDDETNLLSAFTSLMRREGYQIHTLSDSTMIRTALEKDGPFALAISDQRMPGLDGVGVLTLVKEKHPETVRVLLTGFASQDDTQRAINESGIARYMNKPWNDEALKQLVTECVQHFNMAAENKYLIGQIARQNVRLAEMLDGTVGQSIRLLSNLLLYINPQAANQTEQIRKLGNAILNMLPTLSRDERWDMDRGFDLFNIGIAMLPPLIQVSLNKDGLQAMDRFPVASNHHLVAADLIEGIPRFEKVAAIIRYQKKNYDGSGRPEKEFVAGKDIPLGSRLLHILLDLEKLSTDHFRGKDVLRGMLKRRGIYDAALIDVMLHGITGPKQPRREESLSVFHLAAGMLMAEDIRTKSGQVLLQKSTVLTDASVKILQQWNGYDHILEPIRVIIGDA